MEFSLVTVKLMFIVIGLLAASSNSQFSNESSPTSLSVQAIFGSSKFRREMDELIPKGYEIPVLMNLLLTVFRGSQQLLNPCNLNDFVRDQLPIAIADNELSQPLRGIPRNFVINQVTKTVADGCNLYRNVWVLTETKSLNIFIDQNADHVFDDTVLRNYSHFYFWADGVNSTQVLFLGVIRTDELLGSGATFPALKFLAAMGLRKHPWKFVEFENLPLGDMRKRILETRLRTADSLKKQSLFWESDKHYINHILTSAYNGPETLSEIEMFGIMVKFFSEEMRKDHVGKDVNYDLVCAAEQERTV